MTAEVITYRPRSAVRDVGKALGLSPSGSTGWPRRWNTTATTATTCAARCREAGLDPAVDWPAGS